MPVPGHTELALGWTKASFSANFAAMKYTTAKQTMENTRGVDRDSPGIKIALLPAPAAANESDAGISRGIMSRLAPFLISFQRDVISKIEITRTN